MAFPTLAGWLNIAFGVFCVLIAIFGRRFSRSQNTAYDRQRNAVEPWKGKLVFSIVGLVFFAIGGSLLLTHHVF